VSSENDYGATREIALNRALNVRNILLQNGVAREKVALKITSQSVNAKELVEGPYGSVTLTFGQ
jgi:hypothetical protein